MNGNPNNGLRCFSGIRADSRAKSVVPEAFLANPDALVAVLAKLLTLLARGGLAELLVESGGAGKSLATYTLLY